MKCCFCGPVRNCAPFLISVLRNIELLGTLFDEYEIVIVYDHSLDNSLAILKQYQLSNPRLKLFINNQFVSPYRTHRIAFARNKCLEYVRTNEYPLFVMMDFDDPNAKLCDISILKKYFERNDWDSLSFNTTPDYYDIWALSIHPYSFSYNHFRNNYHFHNIIKQYVMYKLGALIDGELLPCFSAFNGFAIYRSDAFYGSCYDGNVRLDLVPRENLFSHMRAQKSIIMFKDYGHIKGLYEDCEHRAFHYGAPNARIRISKDVLFR